MDREPPEGNIFCKTAGYAEAFEEAVSAKVKQSREADPGGEDTAHDVRAAEKSFLHLLMDKQLEERKFRIEDAIANGDTDRIWQLVVAAIETAFVQYLDLSESQAQHMIGRAHVQVHEHVHVRQHVQARMCMCTCA